MDARSAWNHIRPNYTNATKRNTLRKVNKSITSVKNPLIRDILQLQEKSRKRKKEGRFIIEGLREFELAVNSDFTIETLLICTDILPEESVQKFNDFDIINISKEVYEKLSHRKSTEGIIAVAEAKSHKLTDFHLGKNPLILIAEAPEKPGNIGALLRTADAARVDLVIIANPKTDLYNPNIIRSSVGCLFTTNIATGTSQAIIDFLKSKNIQILCAVLSDESVTYTEVDMTGATAIVVGTEATGLSEQWLNSADKKIIIPMEGKIDSLNVSVSAAILIFEAKRQRNQALFIL